MCGGRGAGPGALQRALASLAPLAGRGSPAPTPPCERRERRRRAPPRERRERRPQRRRVERHERERLGAQPEVRLHAEPELDNEPLLDDAQPELDAADA